MKRRGVGVAHVQHKTHTAKAMADVGAQIDAERTARLADSVQLLEDRLKDLAKKHEAVIRQDSLVRSKFKQLADSLGIDLLESNSNVFAKTLGFGDYYYDLCVKAIEICIHERQYFGNMVPMNVVLKSLQRQRPNDTITENDVCYAMEKVHVLGSGYNVVRLSDKAKYIRATPEEMSSDVMAVLQIAAQKSSTEPVVSISELVSPPLNWSSVRAQTALSTTLQQSLSWLESHGGSTGGGGEGSTGTTRAEEDRYWFLMLLPQLSVGQ